MIIQDLNILSKSDAIKLEFSKVNKLSKYQLLMLATIISQYYSFLGADKENKDIAKEMNEDFITEINVILSGQEFYWGRKFNSQRRTFSDLGFTSIKKFAQSQVLQRQHGQKISDLTTYYIHKKLFKYQDGDLLNIDRDKLSSYNLYNNAPLFFERWISFKLSSIQQKDENNFANEFNVMFRKFKFSNQSFKEIGYDYIQEKSYVGYRDSHLHFAFYVIDQNDNKIFFRDMKDEDVEFIILIGELFFRMYMNTLYTGVEKENSEKTEGIFISYLNIGQENEEQLTKIFSNQQWFFLE